VNGNLGGARNAAELARAFDRSFADPVRSAPQEVERLLAIRVGGDPYAVRLRDISGLVVDRKIVPLPRSTSAAAVGPLGLVGLRGGLAVVYSLGALLGHGAIGAPPRWLLLVGAGPLFGLAFDDFDGHREIASADISSRQDETPGAPVPDLVRIGDAQRGLISIATLTETITAQISNKGRIKET
jgi:purine-binding chemotaxis protein CheW